MEKLLNYQRVKGKPWKPQNRFQSFDNLKGPQGGPTVNGRVQSDLSLSTDQNKVF